MKHYIYKTTNLINGKIYIGKRSHENPEKDRYLGSGRVLIQAIKKYGRENFKKQVLHIFESEDQAYAKQQELVNIQFIRNDNVYNTCSGGRGGRKNMVVVKTLTGKIIVVPNSHPKYLSGELVSIHKGKVAVIDKEGNKFCVNTDDPRYLSGQLLSVNKGYVVARDKFGNNVRVKKDSEQILSGQYMMLIDRKNKVVVRDHDGSILILDKNDARFLSGQFKSIHYGRVGVIDSDGVSFKVEKDDPRYISGELVGHNKGKKINSGTYGYVMTRDTDGKFHRVKMTDPRYISGQLVFIRKKI